MDLVTISAILGSVAAFLSAGFAIWIWLRKKRQERRKETRQYFTLGATLAKLGYHRALKTNEKDVVETLRMALGESVRKLDLSPELRKEMDGFGQSRQLTSDELPNLRNKITRMINISINPSAATSFYLGFNVIHLLMMSQLGTVAPTLDYQSTAVQPFKAVLAEVIRDSDRVGFPVRKLRRLERLPSEQPRHFFAQASRIVPGYLDICEKILGETY